MSKDVVEMSGGEPDIEAFARDVMDLDLNDTSRDDEPIEEDSEEPESEPEEPDEEEKAPEADEDGEEDEDLEDDDDLDEEQEPSEDSEDVEMVTLKAGEKEFEVPEDAAIPVKIDGQWQEVSIKEAQRMVSGHTHLDRRFQEFQKQEGELNEKIERNNQDVEHYGRVNKMISEGKSIEGLALWSRRQGKDPKAAVKAYLNDALTFANAYSQMGEEQRAAWLSNLEAGIDRFMTEEDKAEFEAEKEKHAVASQRTSVQQYLDAELEAAEYTYDDFNNTLKQLNDAGVQLRGATPEDRANEVLDYMHYQRVSEIAEELNRGAVEKTLLNKMSKLTLAKEAFTPEEIRTALKVEFKQLRKDEKKRITENLNRKEQKTRRSKTKVQKKAKEDRKPIASFEDWEDEFGGYQ